MTDHRLPLAAVEQVPAEPKPKNCKCGKKKRVLHYGGFGQYVCTLCGLWLA